jgi:two-component system, sensor histidine kinase LadS
LCQFLNVLMPLFTRSLFRYLLFSCLLVSSSVSAFAEVHDHISQRAYWQDASGQATWQQAQTEPFTPYSGILSRGYTPHPIWIRLEITPTEKTKTDNKLILRVRPVYLDAITLYDPLDTNGKLRTTGDQIEYRDEEYKSLSHTFVIPAGDKPRTVWLQLKATSTTLMHVEALSLEDMQQDEHRLMASYYFSLSFILIFLIVVLLNWINYREFLYAAFVVRNAIYFVYTASFFGFHRYLLDGWIDARTIDLAYNWLIIGTTAFTFWFETRFLSEYKPPRWVRHVFKLMGLWSLSALALLALGQTNRALKVNMMLNGAGVIVLLLLAIAFIDDKKVETYRSAGLLKKKFVIGYYLILMAFLLFSVLPYLGQMAGSEFSANGLVYYALISGLAMTFLLQLRASQQHKANVKIEQNLALSTQQVAFEIIRREEQNHMLTMLMHELKNPLAVIDLAQHASDDVKTKDYVSRSVLTIRNVLDQCMNADRLSDGKLTIQKQNVDLVEIIDDLVEESPNEAHRFNLSFLSNTHELQTDYQCLRIVLNNLMGNAVRYSDASQPIHITVESHSNEVGIAGTAIIVSNTPGISSWPEADKVFHKYYRSTGAKTISGTGLGLFLVRSICTLLGGTCTYEPDDTHVRFKVWLPS